MAFLVEPVVHHPLVALAAFQVEPVVHPLEALVAFLVELVVHP